MRAITKLLTLLGITAISGVVLAVGVVAISLAGRPLGNSVTASGRVPQLHLRPLAVPSKVYDSKGNLIGVLASSDNRTVVPLSAVPMIARKAIIDVEDNTFYQTGPIDVRGIARALRVDLLAGHVVQGGSTITQQLVKNALLSPKRTLSRKLNEAVLSIRLSQQWSKNRILGRYLNTVYFGNGAYGIEAASRTFFGEPVEKLDVAQSALLAAMIENPAAYDPFVHPAAARFRRNLALQQMVHNHTLTAAQAAVAAKEPLPTVPHPLQAPPPTAFLNEVILRLAANRSLGPTPQARFSALYQGGLKIYTTLNPRLQADARAAVAAQMPNTGGRFTASMIAMDPRNGEVRALISGNPTTPNGYDVATGRGGTGRQAGSSFKIFTLMAALRSGVTPNDLIDGTGPCKIDYPGAQPATIANAEPGYGVMTITKATADSVNCAYVRLGIHVGLARMRATARAMGITTYIQKASPATVIGSSSVNPLEMATAYSVLANGGVLHSARFVTKVVAPGGKVLVRPPGAGKRVEPRNTVRIEDQVLQAVVNYGTGTAAALPGRPAAGKTGTTDNFADAWFDGFTPQLVTTVWVGAPTAEVPMTDVGGITVYGGTYPARIWHSFMGAALANKPVANFPAPNLSNLPPPTYIYPPYAPGTIPPFALTPPTTVPTAPAPTTPPPTYLKYPTTTTTTGGPKTSPPATGGPSTTSTTVPKTTSTTVATKAPPAPKAKPSAK